MGEPVSGTPGAPTQPPPAAPVGTGQVAKELAIVIIAFQASGTPAENAGQSSAVLAGVAANLGITDTSTATITATVCSVADPTDCRGPFEWVPSGRRLMAEAMSHRRLSGGSEWSFNVIYQDPVTGPASAAAAQQVVATTMSTADGITAVLAAGGATIVPTSGASAEVATTIVWVEGSSDNKALAGIIAESVVGGLVVVMIIGFVIYKKQKAKAYA